MISLSDSQLQVVVQAARCLDPEKRSIYLQRVASILKFRPTTDRDVAEATQLALCGLVHNHADSAA